MAKWIILYGDRTRVSSEDTSPFDAPGINVQVIIQWPEDDREQPYMVEGDDYYTWLEDRGVWEGVMTFGLWDYLFNMPGVKCVKSGRTINGDVFREIHLEAMSVIYD